MVSGGLARKRRRLDRHEAEEPTENRATSTGSRRDRLRPRIGSPVKNATSVEETEPIVTFSTDSSETGAQRSGETVGAAPQESFGSEHLSGYIGLPHEETIRSVLRPPLSGYDLDRLNYHLDLQDFGTNLQRAANAVFASDRRSKYTKVSSLLLSWEDEDPQLPVSLEIKELRDVFVNLYGFEVDEWHIPANKSHEALNLKILQFLDDSSTKHLKLVYYAGHGKLSTHGQAIWTSHRNKSRERPPTVKWSGIQNALEESHSDVLILLDCCASGLSNTDEGNGVTELLAACAFNNIANGVGPYSFTHALISQLRKLAHLPFFTVGYLYNLLFAKIQSLEIDDVSRKKAPIHLVLTQDNLLPRSIRISAKRVCPRLNRPSNNLASEGLPLSNNERNFVPDFIEQDAASSQSSQISSGVFSPDSGGESSSSSITQLPEYPRILLSIRVNESIKPNELSPELFAEWLGTIPLLTKSVRVEAGFASDSTLLMVSVPIAVLGYLPKDPAITMLGVTRSTNMLSTVDDHPPTLPNILELGEDDIVEDRQQDTQDSGFEDMSIFYDDKMESPKAWRDTPKMKFAPPGRCRSCNRTETPQWRAGPEGPRTLCNACYSNFGRRQTPKSGSPLRQSISLPMEELSSPSVRKTLFEGSTPQSPESLDKLSLLRKELAEKEQLIAKLRDELANAKAQSKQVWPDNWANSIDIVPELTALKRESSKHSPRDEDSRDKDERKEPEEMYGNMLHEVKQEHDNTIEVTTGEVRKDISYAHVGACNVCHQLGIDCNRSLPRCTTCEHLNARCTGFNPLSKTYSSRSYVVFLENRVHYLEQRLDDHIIPYKPAEGFNEDDQPEFPEACHDTLATTLATSSNTSNRFLHTDDSYGSPITPPISAGPESSIATRKSHLDLPKIVVISDENICTEPVFPITPESSETNVSDRNGLFKNEETRVIHAKLPVSPSNDQSSSGQKDTFIEVADSHKQQIASFSASSSGSDWLPPSWDSGLGDELPSEQPAQSPIPEQKKPRSIFDRMRSNRVSKSDPKSLSQS